MPRIRHALATMCLAPVILLADFSNDVAYIAENCFTVHHVDAFEGSLRVFAKRNNLSDEEMADRLLYIAANPFCFKNCSETSPVRAAVSSLYYFPNAVNALPALEKYMSIPETRFEALGAYGIITRFSDLFFTFTTNAVARGKLDKDFYLLSLCAELSNATSPSAKWERSEKSLLRMKRILANGTSDFYDNMVYFDRCNCNSISDYTNSVEHVRAQCRIIDLLDKKCERIVKYSCYRGEWGTLSDEEWCQRVTNQCQSEIARVMALPENERLNMTAILDAKIADIEAAEARAARRAVWKRRLRLGAFLVLPVLGIAVAILFVLKKKTTTANPFSVHGCGKAGWSRTVELFLVVIATVSVVGVVSFFERRREVQETPEENNPSATLGLESTCEVWQKEIYDKYRQEKERADAAVLNYRVTNQLDSIVGKCESLKLAHNQLLADLARAEFRMSNETDVVQLDLLRKQTAALREKVAENVRAREELYECISNQEHTLIQLESARKLANQNYLNFFLRMEQVLHSATNSPPANE